MITKFMGTQGFAWFIGTVEDNNDPLRLGRLKVRCHGYHSEDRSEVATEHLPWATLLQPTTSAGLQGGGISPTGAQIGTQVMGFFADGSTAQYPIIFGVLGGVNNSASSPEGTLTRENLAQRIAQGNVEGQQQADTPVTGGTLGSLSESQYQEYKNALGQRESRNIYTAVNSFGYAGKYQFGLDSLSDTGYSNRKSSDLPKKLNARGRQVPDYSYHPAFMNDPSTWTGKDGISSKQAWLNNRIVQERALDDYTRRINYNTLLRRGVLTTASPPREVSAYLFVAHLVGPGGAELLRNNPNARNGDGYSTPASAYYRLGFNSITDTTPQMR